MDLTKMVGASPLLPRALPPEPIPIDVPTPPGADAELPAVASPPLPDPVDMPVPLVAVAPDPEPAVTVPPDPLPVLVPVPANAEALTVPTVADAVSVLTKALSA